jgi:hypothetical protein
MQAYGMRQRHPLGIRSLNYAFKMRIVAFREMGNQPSMREEMRVEMRITRAWPAPNAA